MAAINNENVVIDIDSQSCTTFLKVSNDLLNSFCDSGECNFKPTRGCTKTLSPVTNIHQTIIQMESKVIYSSQILSFSNYIYVWLKQWLYLLSAGLVIPVAGGSPTLMKPLLWPTITTFSPARKVKKKEIINLSRSRLLFCFRAQSGGWRTLQHHHAVLLWPEQLSSLQSFTQPTNNEHRHWLELRLSRV